MSPAPEPVASLPDCTETALAAPSTANTTASTTTINTTTRDEETPPPLSPPGGEHKIRYLHRTRRRDQTLVAAATMASVAACSNQTPMSAAATTPSQQHRSEPLRRSKRKAANPVTPEEEESSSSFLTTPPAQTKKPKSSTAANAATAAQQTKKKNSTTHILPLPCLRTESFQAQTPKTCFPALLQQQGKQQQQQPSMQEVVIPHTLILGTHPSIKSLQQDEYYSHSQNAFWWIAGDCLGFRRDTGISESTGKPFVLTTALRHGTDKILSYPQQMQQLIKAGFLLWDIVASCERTKQDNSNKNKATTTRSTKKVVRMTSMDQDIKNEVPNDIRSFCAVQYPTIRRIVFANGQTGSSLFCKHNKEWLASGELCAGADELSQRHFAKACSRSRSSGGDGKNQEKADDDDNDDADEKEEPVQGGKDKIELIAAISVSPAAAKLSYRQKRDWWEKNVYQPGLRDHKDLLLLQQNANA